MAVITEDWTLSDIHKNNYTVIKSIKIIEQLKTKTKDSGFSIDFYGNGAIHFPDYVKVRFKQSYARYDSSEYSTPEEALTAGKKEFKNYNKDLYKLQVFIYKGNNKIKYLENGKDN